ncbi:MAG: NAD-dependent DNA ligase LigA, partial [Clostridia bacterium]|nr:NAD-dependent DNA ligase LigA [Clostridia bacterium]
MEKLSYMKELVGRLNEASMIYYSKGSEIMPNIEYDRLYDELLELEAQTGVVLSNSPTQQVGYEVLSDLPKERHPQRMLSLDKTKEVSALEEWIGNHEGLLSWKLDGLTIVLTYEGGRLSKAVTRGNGEIGEVITENARQFANLPLSIPFTGKLVLRGEAVITYSDFHKINETIEGIDAKYKNPRNLCSGSVRQLNTKIAKERNIRFYAFTLVMAQLPENAENEENAEKPASGSMPGSMPGSLPKEGFRLRSEQLGWLRAQGFEHVEYVRVTRENLSQTVSSFAEKIVTYDVPSDGLVLTFDDIEYGKSLGTTAKFPRDAIAFKWRDETKETKLLEIEWSASRTGLINPVAVFEPVELEGTTVSRASVHNVSILRELKLGIGDTVCVYKANMIIPQISGNLTGSNNVEIPQTCPVCGRKTALRNENGVVTLICENPECPAKQVKAFAHFVSRNAMNMDGLSEATMEKLIDRGLIRKFADLFRISQFEKEITEMEGFGEKSFRKLCEAVEKARNTVPARFLFGLGIPGIGSANAKLICRHCGNDWARIQNLNTSELVEIEGIGEIMAENYVAYFSDEKNRKQLEELLAEIHFEEIHDEVENNRVLEGKTFVITGSLEHFENREALKELIERLGGKAAGSVSAKTSYLINNDNTSNSTKNRKAGELGVPVITEEEFLELAGKAAGGPSGNDELEGPAA